MGVHRIAVISDTHGVVPDRAADIIKGCDALFHCGDIADAGTYRYLSSLLPVFRAVRGNADRWQDAQGLDTSLLFELFGVTYFMTHRKADIPAGISADAVLYGHTHRYEEYRRDGVLYLNPGAAAERLLLPASMAVITAGDGISVQRICLSDTVQTSDVSQVTVQLVKKVCCDADRGYTAEEISLRHSVDAGIAAQILRMYVTHPGVTPEGIMTKLGL